MNRSPNDDSPDTRGEAPSERRTINCRVSTDAYDTWRAYCEAHGVSLTAVLEAIAIEMRQVLDDKEMGAVDAAIVERARRIDAHRRARRPGRHGSEPSTEGP